MSIALIFGCSRDSDPVHKSTRRDQPSITLKDIDALIAEFEPAISHYPPDVENDDELKLIETKYDRVLAELDKLVMYAPSEIEPLLKRGHLQRLGHNMDKDDAWKGCEADFKKVLDLDARNVQAMLELAVLYIDSEMSLAPAAQELLERAQEAHGAEPLYDAQRNLFLAIYMQGNMKKALEQAKFLVKTFPDDASSKDSLEMIKAVLERISKKK